MKHKYAYGLLENAWAFVESAVNYARQDRQEQWKFAVLHLTTALELLLKARLALEDPKQLAARSTPITERQFEQGDFRTVGIEDCIERLARMCRFCLNQRERAVIETLRGLRNRVVHYINPSNSNELKAAVGAGLNLFIEINNAEFRDEEPFGAKTTSQVVVELHKCDDFVKERLASLSNQLRSSPRPRTHHTDECSHCLQDATVIDGDDVRCLFCGHGEAIQEFAEGISVDRSVETCPECGRQSVAKHQWKDCEPTYECFCCGHFRGPELKCCAWNGTALAEIPRLHPVGR
jgi:hypothetical protein